MNATSIEWTDLSVNPIRARRLDGKQRVPGHFCEKISPGCANCYASRTQPRFGLPQFPGTNKSPADMGVELFLDQKVLESVLKRRKPAKLFWFDMTDAFGDWVPFEWLDQCFAVMALTPHLTHQVLTKRPERMAEYLAKPRMQTSWGDGIGVSTHIIEDCIATSEWPLPNVWLGTSVENQEQADKRIPHLLKCPAAVRFLSVEPLLGPVDLRLAGEECEVCGNRADAQGVIDHGRGCYTQDADGGGTSSGEPRREIHWVIVGGESGHGARQCPTEWIKSIVDQCRAADTPCFVKQLGSKPVWVGALKFHPIKLKDSKGGDPSEWPAELRIRQMPFMAAPEEAHAL
jgi:protein gp37